MTSSRVSRGNCSSVTTRSTMAKSDRLLFFCVSRVAVNTVQSLTVFSFYEVLDKELGPPSAPKRSKLSNRGLRSALLASKPRSPRTLTEIAFRNRETSSSFGWTSLRSHVASLHRRLLLLCDTNSDSFLCFCDDWVSGSRDPLAKLILWNLRPTTNASEDRGAVTAPCSRHSPSDWNFCLDHFRFLLLPSCFDGQKILIRFIVHFADFPLD